MTGIFFLKSEIQSRFDNRICDEARIQSRWSPLCIPIRSLTAELNINYLQELQQRSPPFTIILLGTALAAMGLKYQKIKPSLLLL